MNDTQPKTLRRLVILSGPSKRRFVVAVGIGFVAAVAIGLVARSAAYG